MGKEGKARHLTLAPGLCNLELLDYLREMVWA